MRVRFRACTCIADAARPYRMQMRMRMCYLIFNALCHDIQYYLLFYFDYYAKDSGQQPVVSEPSPSPHETLKILNDL